MEAVQAQDMTVADETGVLYVVATPIGNLGDIAPRAREILVAVEVVVCEDTRRTSRLLAAIGGRAHLVSCFEHKEARCAQEVLGLLSEGVDCAFLTDAGTPNISDPGRRLMAAAFQSGIRVVPIPGPSAVTTIMSCAPFAGNAFYFAGFLPEKTRRRRKELEKIRELTCPVIFFEAPHRVVESLKDVLTTLGDRRILMGRELTKLHEEVYLARVSELIEHLESRGVKGEFTFCVEGLEPGKGGRGRELDRKTREDLALLIEAIKAKGSGASAVRTGPLAAAIARLTGIRKGVIYEMILGHFGDGNGGPGHGEGEQ